MSFFFENLACLAIVCAAVAVVEDGSVKGGFPRFAMLLRTHGGGFGDGVSDNGE